MTKLKQFFTGLLVLCIVLPVVALAAWLSIWLLIILIVGVAGVVVFLAVISAMKSITIPKLRKL